MLTVLIGLGLIALAVAVVALPGRQRRQVDAERWWRALHTLRDGARTVASPESLTNPYGRPEHVRVIRQRGRRADG